MTILGMLGIWGCCEYGDVGNTGNMTIIGVGVGVENANLRQDPDGQDDHSRSRIVRHNRQCQGQDPRQGRVRHSITLIRIDY